MAIEMRHDIQGKEARLPLLGEAVLTPDTIEKLKVPETVASLGPVVIEQFLARQCAQYQSLVNRADIKSLECAIPEHLHDERAMMHVASSLSPQEQSAFDDWSQTLVSTQDVDLDQLDSDVNQFVEDMIRAHPELARRPTTSPSSNPSRPASTPSSSPSSSPSSTDTSLDDVFGIQETPEERQRWVDAFNANQGDPSMLALLYGYRTTGQAQNRLSSLLEAEKADSEQMDRLRAELDLEGPNPSPEAISRFNAGMSRLSSDRTTRIQLIQKAMNDMERDISLVSKIIELNNNMKERVVNNIGR